MTEYKIRSNPNCPNVRCMGGIITTNGYDGVLCRKCNPVVVWQDQLDKLLSLTAAPDRRLQTKIDKLKAKIAAGY